MTTQTPSGPVGAVRPTPPTWAAGDFAEAAPQELGRMPRDLGTLAPPPPLFAGRPLLPIEPHDPTPETEYLAVTVRKDA